jgi:hypothetical protein
MLSFWSKFSTEVYKATLSIVLKASLLFVIAWASSFIGADVMVASFATLKPYKVHLIIILVATSSLFVVLIIERFSRRRPSFPSLDCDFHIIEKHISIHYQSPEDVEYRRRYKLRCRRRGQDTFHDKFHWTGGGVPQLKCVDNNHTVTLGRLKNVWQYYDVTFPKALKKNESIETEIIWTLRNVDKKMVPFISTTLIEPTDHLKFSVFLCKELGVNEVFCEHAPELGSDQPFSTHTVPLDQGHASWSIANPKILHHYEVRWIPHEK